MGQIIKMCAIANFQAKRPLRVFSLIQVMMASSYEKVSTL
jgi:hypothetical protein